MEKLRDSAAKGCTAPALYIADDEAQPRIERFLTIALPG
jgi:hypothetical protein